MRKILLIVCILLSLSLWGQNFVPGFWHDPYEMATETDTVCGSEFEWHGKIYTQSGSYVDTIIENGVKMPVALNLILSNPQPSKTFVSIQEDEFPYFWNAQAYFAEGTYSITFQNEYGCDSIAYLYIHTTSECEPPMEVIHIDRE